MANFVDTEVQVKKVTNEGIMEYSIGPEGRQVDMGQIAAIQNGDMADIGLIYNMSISLKLAGVDLTDEIAIKDHIEKKTFKVYR
jgi:hypothetical protein